MIFTVKKIQMKIKLSNIIIEKRKSFKCILCNSEYDYYHDIIKHFNNHEDAQILLGILDNTPRSEWREEIQ